MRFVTNVFIEISLFVKLKHELFLSILAFRNSQMSNLSDSFLAHHYNFLYQLFLCTHVVSCFAAYLMKENK